MNAQQTNEIRELTAAELDAVSGGVSDWSTFEMVLFSSAAGVIVGGIVGWIVDLFD